MLGKGLTFEKLDKCIEIQSWLNQFSDNDVLTAKSLLCRLQFISRDEYSNWLLSKLENYSNLPSCAIYAVRKFRNNASCLWRANGATQPRPAQTQGSEDLVASVISNANRLYNNQFLDHPSLNELRTKKIQNIILVDDSIGSGKRVADFIRLMTNSKTFLSWWSGGFINIHILSYARTFQSERVIMARTPGSDHGRRKIRLSQKLKFDSDMVYNAEDIHTRWGNSSKAILSLCSSCKKVPRKRRKGFGDVMANIVFYHSVPNNIPGLLYTCASNWNPLFSNRSLPEWAINLLEDSSTPAKNVNTGFEKIQISNDLIQFLKLVKSGLRTIASLSRRMNCDKHITRTLIRESITLGFISSGLRLLKPGQDYLHDHQRQETSIKPDYSLYLPQSWCADQVTVQPSDHDASKALVQTDSIGVMPMDGGGGEPSLDRTDAMATLSPMMDVTHNLSWARKRHILHGPTGLKE